MSGLGKVIAGLSSPVGIATTAVTAFTAAVAGALKVTKDLAVSATKSYMDFELMGIQLGVLTGNIGVGKELAQDLDELAKGLPVLTDELIQASRVSLAFGEDLKLLPKHMKAVATASLAVDQPMERITMWVARLADEGSRGYALRFLSMMGLNLRNFGKFATGEIQNATEAFEEFEKYISQRMAGTFEEYLQTLYSRIRAVRAVWIRAIRRMGEPISKALVPILNKVIKIINRIKESGVFDRLGESIGNLISSVEPFMDDAGTFLSFVMDVVASFVKYVSDIVKFVGQIYTALNKLPGVIKGAINPLGNVLELYRQLSEAQIERNRKLEREKQLLQESLDLRRKIKEEESEEDDELSEATKWMFENMEYAQKMYNAYLRVGGAFDDINQSSEAWQRYLKENYDLLEDGYHFILSASATGRELLGPFTEEQIMDIALAVQEYWRGMKERQAEIFSIETKIKEQQEKSKTTVGEISDKLADVEDKYKNIFEIIEAGDIEKLKELVETGDPRAISEVVRSLTGLFREADRLTELGEIVRTEDWEKLADIIESIDLEKLRDEMERIYEIKPVSFVDPKQMEDDMREGMREAYPELLKMGSIISTALTSGLSRAIVDAIRGPKSAWESFAKWASNLFFNLLDTAITGALSGLFMGREDWTGLLKMIPFFGMFFNRGAVIKGQSGMVIKGSREGTPIVVGENYGNEWLFNEKQLMEFSSRIADAVITGGNAVVPVSPTMPSQVIVINQTEYDDIDIRRYLSVKRGEEKFGRYQL